MTPSVQQVGEQLTQRAALHISADIAKRNYLRAAEDGTLERGRTKAQWKEQWIKSAKNLYEFDERRANESLAAWTEAER